ncbi:hypothetical protein ACHAWF_008570 [Thalassiosira exigua]
MSMRFQSRHRLSGVSEGEAGQGAEEEEAFLDEEGGPAEAAARKRPLSIEGGEEPVPPSSDPHASGLGGTLPSAALGIIKGMVGPAILYLPHAFAKAGYLVAVPILALASALYLWSSRCLLECWRVESDRANDRRGGENGRRIVLSYPELARRAYGPRGEKLVMTGISLMQSGVCLTYLIFVPQNLSASASSLLGREVSADRALLSMVAMQIPLSWIRDIRSLAPTNLLASVLIAYGLVACLGFAAAEMGGGGIVVEGTEAAAPESLALEVLRRARSLPAFVPSGWFLFLGTSVLLFEGSITLLVPLQEAVASEADRAKFPGMYPRVILGIVSFYAFFGSVCWMAFGDDVHTVLTTSLPPGTAATMVQLAYSLAVVLTFPLQNFPSLEIVCAVVERIMSRKDHDGDATAAKLRRGAVSSLLVLSLSVLAALTMDDLDKVVSLMGSLLGCPLAFVLPPLIQNRLESGRISLRKARTNAIVATMGVGAMVVSSICTIMKWG